MKRHESLAPVSRQHHNGLLTARLLQKDAPAYKGMPTTLAGKRDYVLRFLKSELEPHFAVEEKTIFILARTVSEELKVQADVLETEHRQLEKLINDLLSLTDESILADKLHETGKLLEQHIRKEERIFFELLQQELPDEKLQELKLQIEQHLH
ncbi:hemerythrin domain-containing protein [Pontibacter vulgaris]|uniref:hemerythrin domain-containing protein n=1 Tax=Pontibacter vulgaris TaxID=2905679 RepID=UPI001FA6BA11|nr:hemerythrin domain-containing protein [Pontibacter vulgaris]